VSGSLLCDNLAAYSLQVGLLTALAACLPWLLRLRAPRARLLFWQLLLAACLLLPVMRTWRPRATAGDVEVSTAVARVARTAPGRRPIPWNAVALALVAAGALGRLAWLGVGFRRLRRYRLHAVPFAQSEICPTLLSAEISSPVTFGLRRPVILLPAAFPALSLPMQQAILCHERAHVERRDWLFTVAEEVVRALWWFHPAIWWLLSEIQLAREQTVDQRVVAATGARDPYIDALLSIAGAGMELDLAPAPLFLRRRHLKQRVMGILKEKSMSKSALISALAASLVLMAAACWFVTGAVPLAAAPQAIADAAGVSIDLNGAPLLHRTPVDYPASAIAGGIEGTVSVEVTLDAEGDVSGASVLSGPEELRKPVMQSVASWHFGKDVAGSTRVVNVDFALPPKREPTVSAGFGPTPPAGLGKALKGIDVEGLSGQAQAELLARLPVHTGDVIDAARMGEIRAAALAFDPHLAMALAPAGDDGVTLRIAPVVAQPAVTPGQPPLKIRVGGNVQAANLIEKQVPVYPMEAKSARIQGKVQLQATIGPDGHIEDLQVLSGDPILVRSAVEAVRNWVYRPTLLNGNPVTVVTTIDVNFTLSY
jgi:TonB family protein